MWDALYDAHQQARRVDPASVETQLRERVTCLVGRGHCDLRFQGKLTSNKNPPPGRRQVWVKPDAGQEAGAIPLSGLREWITASLRIDVLIDDRQRRVEAFTIALEGFAPPIDAQGPRRPLLISVELDDRDMGSGAAGHAPIHCHVGPSHTAPPEVRVPFPAVKPWEALDWVLTVAVPGWEPLPWRPPDTEARTPADWGALRRAFWRSRQ